MYHNGPESLGTKSCQQPRSGVTVEVGMLSIDKKVATVFSVDGVTYTNEDEAFEAAKKALLKAKGEWVNYIEKNYK